MTQVRRDEDAWRMIGEMRNEIAQLQRLAQPPALITDGRLPENPYPDQEIAVQIVVGVNWRFRHNADSPSPYKWEFEGGSPMSSQNDTNYSGSTTVAYTGVETGFATERVPFSGDYITRGKMHIATTSAYFYAWISPGNVGNELELEDGTWEERMDMHRADDVAAGTPFAWNLACVTGGTQAWQTHSQYIEYQPIRVG